MVSLQGTRTVIDAAYVNVCIHLRLYSAKYLLVIDCARSQTSYRDEHTRMQFQIMLEMICVAMKRAELVVWLTRIYISIDGTLPDLPARSC
jgi:hypothetical protein